VAAVLALLSQGLLRNLNYFETVDQALAHRSNLGVRDFRLEGVVAAGTVQRTSTGASFWLNGDHTHEVYVVATGEPPQLFQPDIPVVVDGHFVAANASGPVVFRAHQIIVKHSADYRAQHPGRVRAPDGSTR
jgi:cytochrome c-type biogenesis protein CcmE